MALTTHLELLPLPDALNSVSVEASSESGVRLGKLSPYWPQPRFAPTWLLHTRQY